MTYKSALLGQPGPYLLGLASIQRHGGFRRDSLRTYGGDSEERHLLRPGDLFVSLKDVTQSAELLGAVARVPNDIALGRLTQDTVKLEFANASCDRNFVYWALRAPEYREYCRAHSTGTTNLGLPREDFLSFELPEATAERTALARLLDDIESKIEHNQQLSETLEVTTRALFKSWFVEFDPVRAKAEGRQPYGMDTATAALFPDRLTDSELGEVPSGWRSSPVGDALTVVGGSTPSTDEPAFWDGPHHWVRPKDLSGVAERVLLDTERSLTDEGLRKVSSGLLPIGTVLLSSRAPIGYLAVAYIPVAINQGFIAMICDKLVTSAYALHWCETQMEAIKGRASGTTFPEISKAAFRPIPMLIPPGQLLEAFDGIVQPLMERVVALVREAKSLAQLRDYLLPKLFSGEVRVRAADKIVEAAL